MQYGGQLLEEVADGKYVAGYNNQAGFDTMRFYLRNLYEYGSDNYEVEHDTGAFIAGETAMFAREASVIVEAAKHPELRYGTFPMFNANIAITKSWYVLDNGDAAKRGGRLEIHRVCQQRGKHDQLPPSGRLSAGPQGS